MKKLMKAMNVAKEQKNTICKVLSTLTKIAVVLTVSKYAIDIFRLLLNIEDELMSIRKLSFKNFMASKFMIKKEYDINIDDFIEEYQNKMESMISDNNEGSDDDMKEADDFVVED